MQTDVRWWSEEKLVVVGRGARVYEPYRVRQGVHQLSMIQGCVRHQFSAELYNIIECGSSVGYSWWARPGQVRARSSHGGRKLVAADTGTDCIVFGGQKFVQ